MKLSSMQIAGSKKIVDTLSPGVLNQAVKLPVEKTDVNLLPKYTVARMKIK